MTEMQLSLDELISPRPEITLTDLDEFLGWFDHTTDCHNSLPDKCTCGWWEQMGLVNAILDQAVAEGWAPSQLAKNPR